MKRYAIIPLVLAALVGCENKSGEELRLEAHRRWRVTRAGVLCGIAEEHLKVGQLEAAVAKAEQAVELDEDSSKAQLLLGRAHIEMGNYGAAVTSLNGLLAREPKLAAAFFFLGVAQEKSSHPADALESYRAAFQLDQSSLAPVVAIAEVLVSLGRIREAQLHIESYLPRADNTPAMFEVAGRLATMGGEPDRAVGYYQQASDLDPKNVRYREMLAKAHFSAGQYSEALTILQALTRREGVTCPAWMYTLLGDCYLEARRPLRACEAFWKASELSPDDAGCWANLAKAYLLVGDVKRAVAAGEHALGLQHDHTEAAMVLGYARLQSGQGAKVVELLKRAAAAHPENGTLRCLLGQVYAAAGNRAAAARCYAEVLRREPDNELARRLLSMPDGKERSQAG